MLCCIKLNGIGNVLYMLILVLGILVMILYVVQNFVGFELMMVMWNGDFDDCGVFVIVLYN